MHACCKCHALHLNFPPFTFLEIKISVKHQRLYVCVSGSSNITFSSIMIPIFELVQCNECFDIKSNNTKSPLDIGTRKAFGIQDWEVKPSKTMRWMSYWFTYIICITYDFIWNNNKEIFVHKFQYLPCSKKLKFCFLSSGIHVPQPVLSSNLHFMITGLYM